MSVVYVCDRFLLTFHSILNALANQGTVHLSIVFVSFWGMWLLSVLSCHAKKAARPIISHCCRSVCSCIAVYVGVCIGLGSYGGAFVLQSASC